MLLPIIIAACDRRVVDVDPSVTSPGMNTPDIYALTTDALDGEPVNLKKYHGQVTLLVNVASECGFTPQYTKLQQLQETWQDKGFTVIAFPCNDFGGQEPGTADEIKQTCRIDYKTTFPVMAKVKVKAGSGQSPIYTELQEATGTLPRWNFGKYLVDRNGHPVAFFGSSVDPMSPKIQKAIQQAMDGRSTDPGT